MLGKIKSMDKFLNIYDEDINAKLATYIGKSYKLNNWNCVFISKDDSVNETYYSFYYTSNGYNFKECTVVYNTTTDKLSRWNPVYDVDLKGIGRAVCEELEKRTQPGNYTDVHMDIAPVLRRIYYQNRM